ncbi:2-(1,2-epoxy-1,2-dihydrophenyl)acetyl-CoA isomerase [Marinobacter sp. es.048]|uniref:enoyl-CoA hydratase-related protein n=1 Tax=Marinobacter sp. es.048 TaxID=1761795 RepID=UPI000B58DB24|nr:enoyl-CoA hydratase-related protein [Marinobacter sp. es.048]SNC59846.1 2-(1,2-epoxy-1,2-dihydrophenyl)acetyl-CoA isomerase [Marinobacter sp. es.048]
MTDTLITTAFDTETGVARLTFNRPEALNAINVPLAQAFLAAVQEIRSLSGVRCIVLTGAGRAFMAGGDVSSMAGTSEQAGAAISAILDAVNPAILLLRSMDAPVIAAVRGVAAGAGLSLTLMADLVIAEEDAKFLVAYNGIGAVPDCGGSWFLAHKLGAGRAAELMLLGRTLSATEAKDWGIITEFAPASDYDSLLSKMIKKVANGPTRAFGAFRQLTDRANGDQLAAHLEAERSAFLDMTRTTDFAEGVSAFLAKRSAQFQGR